MTTDPATVNAPIYGMVDVSGAAQYDISWAARTCRITVVVVKTALEAAA